MTRLIVDTNVVRGLGAGELSEADFALIRGAGITVHLGDTTATELVAALLERRLDWTHWIRARDALRSVLHRSEPIALGGQQGLQRAGFPVRQHRSADELRDLEHSLSASWRILLRARSYEQLTQIDAQTGRGTISLNAPLARSIVTDFKAEWVDEIDDFFRRVIEKAPEVQQEIPVRSDSLPAIEACVAAARQVLDVDSEHPLPSVRLDAFLRVRALILLRRMRPREAYAPEKRQNDSLDHELLKYLAFPAVLCTNDRRLIAAVESAHSWQRGWLVQTRHLRDIDMINRIKTLRWPETGPA